MNKILRSLTVLLVTAIGCAHTVDHANQPAVPAPPMDVVGSAEPPPPPVAPVTPPPAASPVPAPAPAPAPVPVKKDYSQVDVEFLPARIKSQLRLKVSQTSALSMTRMTMILAGESLEIPTTRPSDSYCVTYNRENQPVLHDGEVLHIQQIYREVGTLQIYLTHGVYLQCFNTQGLMTINRLNAIFGKIGEVSLDQ